jgi:hypothetical protein
MSRFRACWMTQDRTGCSVGAQDPDAPAAAIGYCKDVYLRAIEQVSGEEIQRQDPLRLRPQELRPARAVPAGRRIDPGVLKDLPDR